LFGLSSVAVLAPLPPVAPNVVQGVPMFLRSLLGASCGGAIGGAVLQGRLRERLSSEWIVRLAFAGFAVCSAGLALSANAWASGAAAMVGGACWVLALSLFNVTVQLSTPRGVVGRALALYQTAAFGGMSLGSWLWGELAESHDPAVALLAAAGAILAGGLVGVVLPLPGRADLNLDPLNRWTEPMVAVDLQPRSGPIQIEVEYRIREADVPAFLAVMTERDRVRLRDGARRWTLLRDLEDPMIWVEAYQTPTWVEYVRHNMRRTFADVENTDKLLALHQGEARPRVLRRIVRQTRMPTEDGRGKAPIDHP
jgi:MFS family permease